MYSTITRESKIIVFSVFFQDIDLEKTSDGHSEHVNSYQLQ